MFHEIKVMNIPEMSEKTELTREAETIKKNHENFGTEEIHL